MKFKLTGDALVEATHDKAKAGKPLSMREWQIINLNTCSSVRDVFFPEYCKSQGLSTRVKLTASLWKPIWNTAIEESRKQHEAFLDRAYASIGAPRRSADASDDGCSFPH